MVEDIKRIAILGAGLYSEILLEVMTSDDERARGVEVVATHRRAERRAEVVERFGIRVLESNREACEGADMVIPLVRPEQMAELMEEVGPVIRADQILATGAASLPLSWYRKYLNTPCTLAWVFTPVFMGKGEGYIGMAFEPGVTEDRMEDLKEYWGRFGNEIMVVEDGNQDAFTVLQACSQFFLYPVVKAMVGYGRGEGLPVEVAKAASLAALRCASRELEGVDCTPEGLEKFMDYARVPGNMTFAGIKALEGRGVEDAFREGLVAAQRQSEANRSGL